MGWATAVVVVLLSAAGWWAARSATPAALETPRALATEPAPAQRSDLVGVRSDAEEAPREDVGAPAPDEPAAVEQDPWTVRVQVRRAIDEEPVLAEVLLLGETAESTPIPRYECLDYGSLGLLGHVVATKRTNPDGDVVFRDVALGDYRTVVRPVEGTIVLEMEPFEPAGVEVRDLEFLIVDEASDEQVKGKVTVEGLDVDSPIARIGTLHWSCELAQGPVLVRIRSALGVVAQRLVPKPSTTEVVQMIYP